MSNKLFFSKSEHYNPNYLAQIVAVDNFLPHNNPEVTKLKVAKVGGFDVIVGIDEQPGKFIYFPVNCTINPKFLNWANLYRHTELNNDAQKSGMFEDNGRVKAIRLKGQVSEGFLLPLMSFVTFAESMLNNIFDEGALEPGIEFDQVECNGNAFWVNKKYVIHASQQGGTPNGNNGVKKRGKTLKKFNRILPDQFRFHYDTIILRKCPWVITPDSLISITSKWHGTSHISAFVKCKRPLTFREKLANLILRTPERFYDYDHIYASRSVVKNQYINRNVNNGFYNVDVWKCADDYLQPFMQKGMTIYAEICGYLPTGCYIQKNYDYGCVPPSDGKYEQGVNYKVMVYRITITNVDGVVYEFSAKEVQDWCKRNNLTPVNELYYGYAKDLYKNLDVQDPEWSEKFMDAMANDDNFFMEKNSPDCYNKVPHEGIVIKIEDGLSHAWKLKTFAFLNGEQVQLDKGETNIEDLA